MTMTSPAIHRYCRPVRFSETDAAGVVHFSRLLAIVEEAEHDWFSQLGLPVFGGGTAWPRVKLEVDFRAPCRFGETLCIDLTIEEIKNSSLAIRYAATSSRSGEESRPVFSGRMVICHASTGSDGTFHPFPFPESMRKILIKQTAEG